ncbi:MAG: carboxypeptidase regulatory-like domain-containing protein [Candidatus Acidiferrum sp.]
MRNTVARVAVCLCVFVLAASGVWAQFNGNISGNVQDPTGAAVANASLNLANMANSQTFTTKSNAGGGYRFVSLAPGNYKLSVSATGFATTTVSLTLLTEETINIPVQLSVGTVSEKIEVTTEAPTLNTADSRTEMTIESQAVSNLPIQGRNLLALTTVAPGVTGLGLVGGSPGSAADNFSTETQVDASANGRGSVGNMYVVDGLDVTSDIRPGVLNLTPNPDTIQETTIQPNTFSVEYGRASSVQMVMTSKSGSDQFHGNLSDYYTYQGLWAGTEFLKKYNPFHSSNYSASIGGPVIPHHQFFFFFGIEPLRSLASNGTGTVTFEDAAFTSWASQNFPSTLGTQILKTYTPTGATVTKVSQTAADIFPTTCGTSATANLPCNTNMIDEGVFNSSSYRNALQWNTRIDKYFSKDRLYGNFYRTTLNTGGPAVRPAFTTTNSFVADSLQVNEAHTFTPNTLNEAVFGYMKVQGILDKTGDFTVPSIGVSGVGVGFGVGFAQGNFIQHNYHWRDVLTHIQGSHTFRFGYEGRRGDDLALFAPVYNQPNFAFDNLLDLVQDSPHTQSGLAYDLLSGQPGKGQYEYALVTQGLFAEDTWKAKKNLTFTLGLRWDDFGNPYPLAGTTLANFHLGPGLTLNDQIANGFMIKQNNVFNHTLADSFSPRVGFSWDPTGSATWVVRGGFGIFHDWTTLGNDENGLKGNPPGFVVPAFFRGSATPPIFALGTNKTTPAGFPYPALAGSTLDSHGGVVGSQFSVGGIDTNLGSPVTYNYTVTVEKKIARDFVASVGYSGSQSRNLIIGSGQVSNTSYGVDINRFAGDLIANYPTPKRLNPSFGSITYAQNGAKGGYNAVILAVRGHISRRGYFNASYTRSSSKDDAQIYPTFTNLQQYYAQSIWDAPNRISFSYSYEIPGVGPDNKFAHALTDGWVFSGITIFQSGTPFVVYTGASFQSILNGSGQVVGLAPGSGDYNADGFNYDFPNVASYAQPTSRSAFLNGLFPAGNFPAPTLGSEGNERPYPFRGPNYYNWDVSLAKNTQIYERLSLQLRFDYFNVFNRVNLQGVDSNLQDSTFGKSTSQFNPRWLQLGVSLRF